MRATATLPSTLLLLGLGCASTGGELRSSSYLQTGVTPAGEEPEALTGYDGGFFIRSEDGANELVFEGLFQTVIGLYDGDRDPSADVILKRMRPELSGRVAESLRFKLEPKFTEDDVELEEAWIGFEALGGEGLVMFGRMKAPFSLEEVRSRRHIDFPEFSLLAQFAPAEDHGVFVNGRSPSGLWEYGLAAYNGTGESDTGSTKDIAGRVMIHPFAADAGSTWEHIQLGVAGTIGSQEEAVDGDSIENGLGLPITTYAPGAMLDGRRWRAGLECAWFHGPWMMQGELLAMSQEMSLGASPTDVSFGGAYLTVSHVLTGEDKSFKGVSPGSPFDFRDGGGSGAWVLAARVAQLDLDDELDDAGLAVPGSFTDSIRSASLGLNWIPNDHAIVRNSLVFNDYDDPVTIGSGVDDSEVGFLMELQLHF